MEPRALTEGEKRSIEFLFDDVEMFDNYATVHWKGKAYIMAPIGDSNEYACTSSDVLLTGYSFSVIRERLDAC